MRQNGRLITCERCGTTVFLECIGEGERDGGFTRWNKFEPLPEGWGSFEHYDLCPECNRIWTDIQHDFKSTFALVLAEEVADA